MTNTTLTTVSMTQREARAFRAMRDAFSGDEEMLPPMMRALGRAWEESGEAIGRAGDALDLESWSVAPFVRIGAQALGARLTAEGDRLFRAHPRDEKDALHACATAPLAAAEDASLAWLEGRPEGRRGTDTLYMEADGVYCHLQRTQVCFVKLK